MTANDMLHIVAVLAIAALTVTVFWTLIGRPLISICRLGKISKQHDGE